MTLEESKLLLAKLELLLKLQQAANDTKNPSIIAFVTRFTKENEQ